MAELDDFAGSFAGPLPDGADRVVIRRRTRSDGTTRAYLEPVRPRSVRNLEGRPARAFAELQDRLREFEQARQLVEAAARDCRTAGVSWGAIGWACGMTPFGASKRFSEDDQT